MYSLIIIPNTMYICANLIQHLVKRMSSPPTQYPKRLRLNHIHSSLQETWLNFPKAHPPSIYQTPARRSSSSRAPIVPDVRFEIIMHIVVIEPHRTRHLPNNNNVYNLIQSAIA